MSTDTRQGTEALAQPTTATHPAGRPSTRPYSPPRHPWTIVMRRELFTKLTDKAFLTSTLITLVLIIGFAGVQIFLAQRSHESVVAVNNAAGQSVVHGAHEIEHAANDKNSVTARTVASDAEGRQLVADGAVDAFLLSQPDGSWQLVFEKQADLGLQQALSQALAGVVSGTLAVEAGMTPQELARATTINTQLLDGSADQAMLAQVVSFAFAVLFFMSALTFGMQIAGSVVEEKASRIVEIISAAIPIRHLLAGKVIGNTLLGFGQMAVFGIVALVAVSFTPYKAMLPSLGGGVAWFLVYFIAGFLALACVWAVAGSLASRQEDLQQTTTPLTLILTAVYFAGLFVTGTTQTVLSYLPVLSSVMMPARFVAGTAQWYDLVIGLVINLVFAALTVVVGEKIYRRSLLQTGGVISLRQALKLTD
ncbi:ABC transporter permease [Propionibacteriaceae bacterium G1746]